MPKLAQPLVWFVFAAIIVGLDLATKQWVSANFYYGESRPITDFLNIVLVHNTGAAFSFLSDAGGWQRWAFSVLALGVSIWIAVWLFKLPAHQRLMALALSLVLGGAVGNLWERITQGYVVDFIDVYYKTYHWPAFNVADSAICIGAALLIFDSLKNKGS